MDKRHREPQLFMQLSCSELSKSGVYLDSSRSTVGLCFLYSFFLSVKTIEFESGRIISEE